ncbi:MAG: TIGR01212 family radical SAM protein [Candidatus Omnitrophica bacterium]|nr:TIGR01212 family radical SAM protein [Candidatus Omnitrophota bacterium]
MQLYNDYNTYLRSKYGCKVYRIGLDAGFSCPNRDGTKGTGGCIYCNGEGSRSGYANPDHDIRKQLLDRIDYLKKAKGASKFIAYFQAFTNTYAYPAALKKIYDRILDIDGVVGLSIGTRPDAIDEDKLKLIASYAKDIEVWLELGIQSIHNRTLERINRAHTFEDFIKALALAKKFDLPVSAHVILGLPGETKDDMLETAKRLSGLKIDAVKIHLLHILKGSPLERSYSEGKVTLLTRAEYVEVVCDFLEYLSPAIIIQRLTGQGSRRDHIAPEWALDKLDTIGRITDTLKKRGSRQGFRS